jgi:hypothetical protein
MTKRVTVHWRDLPCDLTAYYRGMDGVERSVRKQRPGLETMIVSRSRPGGEHHWQDQNRIIYDHLTDPDSVTVEVDAAGDVGNE